MKTNGTLHTGENKVVVCIKISSSVTVMREKLLPQR